MASERIGQREPGTRRRSHGAWVTAGAAVGFLLTFVGTFWMGFGGAELARVWYTGKFVDPTTAPTLVGTVCAVATTVGLGLLAAPRAWVRHWLQLLGGCWTLGWVYLFSDFASQAEFTGSEPPCVHTACWPQGYHEFAVAVPLVIAVVTMGVTATVGRRLRWWLRAAVPSLTFVVLTIVQLALWDRAVIPFLSAPPPW